MNNLTQRLSNIIKKLKGEARLTEKNTEEILREIRKALLEADVALSVVKELIFRIKEKSLGSSVLDSLTPGQTMVGLVYKELSDIIGNDLGDYSNEISLTTIPPAVILICGMQGSGKTTTTAKLANWLIKGKHLKNGKNTGKKKVLLTSVDIYRPAAIEQLKILANKVGADFFSISENYDPEKITQEALDYAKKYYYDVLIVDTAGRISIDEYMMNEIYHIYNILKPVETLFILDSMQGQDAIISAKNFLKFLPITGIILTKMDGDARGGASLSVRHVIGKPIKFIGNSEKIDGLEIFYPDRIAKRILGMGDIISIFEETKERIDKIQAKKLIDKINSGTKFNFNDFNDYILQTKKLGNINTILDKLPLNIKNMLPVSENMDTNNHLSKIQAIIFSMTPYERENPDILKSSRKKRIAKGAGVNVQDINKLISQFKNVQEIMKKFHKGNFNKILKNMPFNIKDLLK
ncbi:Signal recognition particle protein [Candidatus Kinetoplastibacterium sorsogonicusi]|uniref:Signal recognition particle protein n=1 Tax=Candidatus Kinetoplastidibacterium kentomonadis TaxID=1576550 RepID=A0A3Q8EXY8_9PROT|nr:signal recognition particle protein [Candidatus Kinetoplastibacterium sorsogonicusi]AWD32223.1 Signal recognition particle protein [Candidatus Kinetoplastibacterium sorsogonicusi]